MSWCLETGADRKGPGERPAEYGGGCICPGVPSRGASGNFGASKQWTGRVCSVICQVHTNICVAVKTVPIFDACSLRGDPRERAAGPPHGLCGDWPSQTSRQRLGRSPTLPSLSRECRVSADRVLVCSAVDWHSLLQWACSPAHGSCQRRYTCYLHAAIYPHEPQYLTVLWSGAILLTLTTIKECVRAH